MAIHAYYNGDTEVATIADRNALTKRIPGMKVVVRDAIADVMTGGGKAIYVWDSELVRWMLTWKETVDVAEFITETKTITNGTVTLSHVPSNGIVWDALVLDGNGILVADLVAPTINTDVITLGTADFNGLTLTVTYAYGNMELPQRTWSIVTSNHTARRDDQLLVDTSAQSITITLPAAPQVGDFVKVSDFASTFDVNNLVINPNGKKITGLTDNLVVDVKNQPVSLIFTGEVKGWVYGI